VLAVFDLLQLRPPATAHDSQKGFNIHAIVLRIPLSEIGGEMQTVGVYATTSRQAISVLRPVPAYTEKQLTNLQAHAEDPFEAGPKPVGYRSQRRLGPSGAPRQSSLQ